MAAPFLQLYPLLANIEAASFHQLCALVTSS